MAQAHPSIPADLDPSPLRAGGQRPGEPGIKAMLAALPGTSASPAQLSGSGGTANGPRPSFSQFFPASPIPRLKRHEAPSSPVSQASAKMESRLKADPGPANQPAPEIQVPLPADGATEATAVAFRTGAGLQQAPASPAREDGRETADVPRDGGERAAVVTIQASSAESPRLPAGMTAADPVPAAVKRPAEALRTRPDAEPTAAPIVGPGDPGAKFAARAAQEFQGSDPGRTSPEKKSVPIVKQSDASSSPVVGIASAPLQSAMPAQIADRTAQVSGAEFPKAMPGQDAGSTHAQPSASESPANLRAAQAVETVVSLVDAQVGRAQGSASAVRIHFNFNGDDLSVRVEVSDGAVRTQFRTDSPELRAAIAMQWQGAAPSLPGRNLSFLQPAFSGSSGNPDSSLGSDGGSPRREGFPEPGSKTPSWEPLAPKPAASRQAAASPALPVSGSGGRLHVFA